MKKPPQFETTIYTGKETPHGLSTKPDKVLCQNNQYIGNGEKSQQVILGTAPAYIIKIKNKGSEMKTQSELEAMSDRGLEELLHKLRGCNNRNHLQFQYCSNPNDIMPLVIKHGIDLMNSYNPPFAKGSIKDGDKFLLKFRSAKHGNILRAATIVLILLLQGEDDG